MSTNMKHHGIIMMITFFCLKTLCNSSPKIVKDKSINKYKAVSGEPVAVSHLIEEFERDHQNLFNKEVNKRNTLEWGDLENKDLDSYCRRYLQHCVPKRTTYETIGNKRILILRYGSPGYEFSRKSIVVVTCTCKLGRKISYHLTRAPEPNCVYALSRTTGGQKQKDIFSIIYKHCDFELCNYDENKKRKRSFVKKFRCCNPINNNEVRKQCKTTHGHCRDYRTGQLIADDESITKYELEHQEMYPKIVTDYFVHWSFVEQHKNLNEYCYEYLNTCIPNRGAEGVIGSWSLKTIQWRCIGQNSVKAIVIKCYKVGAVRSYYFTRALTDNCVYGLLRDGSRPNDPLLIVFKCCNFSNTNFKQEVQECSDIDQYMIPYKEIKTEDLSTLETLQLFPEN